MNFYSKFLFGFLLLAAFAFCGCGDDASNAVASASPNSASSSSYAFASSSSNVASSAGEMQFLMKYSGVVVDIAGAAVAGARVVAYYDGKDQVAPSDSVVAETNADGCFELQLDSPKPFVLLASKGEERGFANSGKKEILIGKPLTMFSGHIENHVSGSVRIEGLDANCTLDGDGYFVFYNVPIGDINIVYIDENKPRAYLPIETLNDRAIVVLPPLYLDENGGDKLKILKEECYMEQGCYGMRAKQ